MPELMSHCVRALIAARANVNLETRNGQTALMYASGKGHAEIVRLLKKAGAKK